MIKILGLNLIALSIFIFSSCHTSKKVVIENPNNKPIDETPLVGNDADEHGCKNSAGYTWSILKNECIRIFEEGVKFSPVNSSSTQNAYLVFISDPKQLQNAELFLPNFKQGILLDEKRQVTTSNEKIIFENQLHKIVVIQTESNFQIQENGLILYTQEYNNTSGLGREFPKLEVINQIIGDDLDEHGCKASAGLSWSQLKNSCVRIWEVGSSFSSINTNETSTAYLILSDNLKRAEVYVPTQKKSILLEKSSNSDKTILFENKDENIEITKNKAEYIIKINGKASYIQNHSKENGLGKNF